MTVELQMLIWITGATILMWIPYIAAHILNVGLIDALTYRADSVALPDWAARAKKAHSNAIENLLPFAVLVIAAALTKTSNDATAAAAITYFWVRLAHYFLYIANVPFGRTLTFAAGWLAMLCLFGQIVMPLV